MENNRIAIIGAGSMGRAILSGLIAAGTAADSITASTATTQSAKALSDKFGIKSLALDASPNANADASQDADVLLIAVKPGKVLSTLEEIKDSIKDGVLVISVAAGVTTESMEQAIGSKASVIRAMPNTPSIVGHGVTGIAKGKSANDSQLAVAKALFDSPETLRAQVTSPNGTTMQATARFDEADLEKVFIEATEAALARAIELGKNK